VRPPNIGLLRRYLDRRSILVRKDDLELAKSLRIEERELEAAGRN
jgi:hypothetical protein